jgi:hypothetical protein
VLTLPEGALQRAGEGAHVWRIQGQAVHKVGVRLGERDARSGEYPVLSGLAAGDLILRSPGSTLVDGQKVEFAAGAAAPAVAASAGAGTALSVAR